MLEIQNEIKYTRNVLYQNDQFEIVNITWPLNSHSPMHNHGWSQCLVLIEEGLFENTLSLGGKTEVQILEKGQVLNTPIGAIHEMKCLSQFGKTLHVYTPKIVEAKEIGRFKIETLEKLLPDLKLDQATRLESLRLVLSDIRANSVSTNSPYFMNQLFSGIMPQSLMADDLISQTKTTMATLEASPAFSAIESVVVRSLGSIIGWPQSEGVCVPGGSAANFMAVHCARHRLYPDIKKTGMPGEKLKVFISADAHYSFKKACAALGLGTDNLVAVPCDTKGRMDVNELDRLIKSTKNERATPLCVVATAGTTVKGAFDPIDQMAVVCKAHGIWLHVDAAWGGPAMFSKSISKLMIGSEHADSMTFDAHKLFGASLTSSFFLTKHTSILLEANDVSGADYLFHSDDSQLDRGKLSWQCGRSAEAANFWTLWKSLGTDGLGNLVDSLLSVRDESLAWINQQPRLKLVAEPSYLNICLRILPPAGHSIDNQWSLKVRQKLIDENLAMVNYATDSEGPFLRLILAHHRLTFRHVKQILEWALSIDPA